MKKLAIFLMFSLLSVSAFSDEINEVKEFLSSFYSNWGDRKNHISKDMEYLEIYPMTDETHKAKGGIEVLKDTQFFFPSKVDGFNKHTVSKLENGDFLVDIQSEESDSYMVKLFVRKENDTFMIYKIENRIY